jgi:hypothetical protein
VSDGCKYHNRNTAETSKPNQNWPAHGFSIGSSSDLTIKDIFMDNSAGDAPNDRSDGKAATYNSDRLGVGGKSITFCYPTSRYMLGIMRYISRAFQIPKRGGDNRHLGLGNV